MSPIEPSPKQRTVTVLYVLLAITSLLTVVCLVYAVKQRNEANMLREQLQDARAEANAQKLQAEKQLQDAATEVDILKIRIDELEIKYDMCMTKQ